MDYKHMAEQILSAVGGRENVTMLTHCATRLRFNLADDSKADDNAVQKIKGVSGVSNKGGQYQVIIGTDVGEPYKELINMVVGGDDSAAPVPKQKKGIGTALVDTLSGIFTPILPAITGAGMLKALLSILVLCGVDQEGNTYQLISVMADAAFYFLPMLLAWSAAKKFDCSVALALTLAGILLHPNIVTMMTDVDYLELFNIPVRAYSYGYSVISIILIVWFMSYIQKYAYKYTPKFLRYFLAPLLTLLITGTVGLTILGPVGGFLGDYLIIFTNFLIAHASLPTMLFFGTIMPLIVLTGMHHGFTPVTVGLFTAYGCDPILYPACLASNMSQAGSAFAVALRAKDKDVRTQAASAGLTALMGITEPALFGVTLRYKKNLYAVMTGGFCAAFFAWATGVKAYANATPGLAAIAMFVSENDPYNIVWALLTIVVAVGVSFLTAFLLGGEYLESSEEEEQKILESDEYELKAPMKGEVIALSEVPDETFAAGVLGEGVAIIPEEGVITSPIFGTVSMVAETRHAIAITGLSGEEILIHVGLGTVYLNGEPFNIQVKAGDKVKAGDVLGKFYLNKIKEAGLSTVTPVVITNPEIFESVEMITGQKCARGGAIMKVHKKAAEAAAEREYQDAVPAGEAEA